MALAFDATRWEAVRAAHRQWWAGDLERPLICLTASGRDPRLPEPPLPTRHFTAHYGLETPASQIVDRWWYNLCRQEYLGDGFPVIWPNFGPGVAAAFLGLELQNAEDTVWFHPREQQAINDIRLQPNDAEPWFQRVAELSRLAVERFEGLVQIGMTDLGGNLDIVSSFRPGDKLLFDLMDNPDAVKRVTWEAHHAWWHYFSALNAILQPANPGYSSWACIYSETPHYMLQCDFCYMISPDMFDAFVKPELAATCARLDNAFYHLDGPGQLPHLDSLLTIPELKGIQWIPGAGQPGITHWPDVYRKIRDAGKLIQIYTSQDEQGIHVLDVLAEQLGSPAGIVMIGGISPEQKDDALPLIERYGGTP